MNENIKQLAAQVRGNMVCLTTVDDVQWKQHEEFVEKFAELIVQECCRVMSEHDYFYGEIMMSPVIKQHFGIEK